MKHQRCVEDHLRQVLSAAITYEGQLAKYKNDSRVYSHRITDSLYDLLVQNLKVFQSGVNSNGVDFSEHQETFNHLVATKYPEFLTDDWHYTGSFFYEDSDL